MISSRLQESDFVKAQGFQQVYKFLLIKIELLKDQIQVDASM